MIIVKFHLHPITFGRSLLRFIFVTSLPDDYTQISYSSHHTHDTHCPGPLCYVTISPAVLGASGSFTFYGNRQIEELKQRRSLQILTNSISIPLLQYDSFLRLH
jgi:hypothetical protein